MTVDISSAQERVEARVSAAEQWTAACAYDFLIPGRGVAVLLKGGVQAALFRLADDSLRAVSNIDPFGKAAVLSRGIIGDRAGEPTVASPLLKQVFSLDDGRCLDDPDIRVAVFSTRVVDGIVEVGSMGFDSQ
ncbi:MAG: nitrite reductase small subunit NirD [Mycobacteriaceae bacterium]